MATLGNGFAIAATLEAAAAIEADLRRLMADLTEAQFHAPPSLGGWSVGHCIEHLILTGKAYLPRWDAALRQAHDEHCRPVPEFSYGWWQRIALRLTEDPTRLKRRTPAECSPYARFSIEDTLMRFLGMHRQFTRRVAGAGEVDVRRVKVRSPFSSHLRFALGFSFDLVLAHERRHLRQAWEVRREVSARVTTIGGTSRLEVLER